MNSRLGHASAETALLKVCQNVSNCIYFLSGVTVWNIVCRVWVGIGEIDGRSEMQCGAGVLMKTGKGGDTQHK